MANNPPTSHYSSTMIPLKADKQNIGMKNYHSEIKIKSVQDFIDDTITKEMVIP